MDDMQGHGGLGLTLFETVPPGEGVAAFVVQEALKCAGQSWDSGRSSVPIARWRAPMLSHVMNLSFTCDGGYGLDRNIDANVYDVMYERSLNS